MDTHDISRHLLQPRKHYTGVRMQQRRTITDADFDEGERVRDELERRTRVDLVGESGSPDLGFGVDPDSLETLPDDTIDFALSAGRLYVGGQALELFEDERFRYQRDWLQQGDGDRLTLPQQTRQDVVFVLAWQAVVTPVEDAELYEASLGPHVDASVRRRQFTRVMTRENVTGDDCDQAWANASAGVLADLCPGAALAPDGEVLSPIQLTVACSGDTQTEDPCAPCVDDPAGGYLAAENQAIRVMLVGDGTRYTWGLDNGSPLHRVRLTGTTLEIIDPPTRERLHPLRGQIIELLPWGARLDNGQKAAEPLGYFTSVSRSFDARDGTLELDAAPPPGTFVDDWSGHPDEDDLPGSEGVYLFMRLWGRGSDRSSSAAVSIAGPGTPQTLGNTGLTVEFSTTQGCPADYWVIAARRDQPSQVVPWDLQDVAGAPPHGPRRFMAPLARVDWEVDAGSGNLSFDVIDCRPRFVALADRSECCTFTVRPGGTKCAGGFDTIQAAIDALPPAGGTICVQPGTYAERIQIDQRVDVCIRGCGPRTRIVNPLGAQRVASGQDLPLVLICNSQRIKLESLAVEADGIAGVRVVHGTQGGGLPPQQIELRELRVTARDAAIVGTLAFSQARSALELFGAHEVRVEECALHMSAPLSAFPAAFLLGHRVSLHRCHVTTTGPAVDAQPWGGVQVPGGASDVTLDDCDIEGGLGHGITLGSVNYAPLDASGLPLLAQQTAVPVGVAALVVEEGAGVVSLFAQPRLEDDLGIEPVPGPIATRIRIVNNRIHGAITSGIAAAAFWPEASPDPTRPSAISLAELTIEDNEISGNAQLAPRTAEVGPLARLPGVGGISLPAVAGLRVKGNRIVDNGTTFTLPIVGLYVLEAAVAEVCGNTITGNGRRDSSTARPRRGRRGGVVVMRAVVDGADVLSGDAALAGYIPPAPREALVVRGNVIAQPEGKALHAPDLLGNALVVSNTLGSHGDTLPPVDTTDEVQLEVSVLPVGSSVPDRRSHTGLGAVVYLRNNVRSLDAFTSSSQGQLGSRIGFDSNQVTLDWLDSSTPGPQLCSVLIDALLNEAGAEGGASGAGDVSVVGNGFQAVMHGTDDPDLVGDPARNLLLCQVVALGRSVRLLSNRIAEGRTDAMLSAFVWSSGFPSWASLNVTTHCIVSEPVPIPPPIVDVVLDNIVLGPSGTSCTFEAEPQGPRSWLLQEQTPPPP